jgi:hypothetical protein
MNAPAVVKYTAAVVREDCPHSLSDYGKKISAHLDKADKYTEKADQHRTSASRYLAIVHGVCDDGGFDAFHKKFLPKLGRSRTFELLAIGSGKKSVEDTKASTRERVARHRAKRKGESVTSPVTDKAESVTSPVTDKPPARSPAPSPAMLAPDGDPHAERRRLNERLAEEGLVDCYRRCADELPELLDEVGVDRLFKAMSKEFRAALRERLEKPGKPFKHTLTLTAENSSKEDQPSRH